MNHQILITGLPSTRRRRPDLLRAMWRALVAWRIRQRDYNRLMEMPDHMLKDIGLTRNDVRCARNTDIFWHPKP